MKNTTLVVLAIVILAVLLVTFGYLATFTTVFKKEVSSAQATSLSTECLQLANTDIHALVTKLANFSSTDEEEIRAMLETSGFANPKNVTVDRIENHILIGGLDEKSITNVGGSYTCGETELESRFSLQLMYEDSTWKLSDFFVTGCQKQTL